MGQPPGDSSRWFVAEQNGRIFSFDNIPNPSITNDVLTISIIDPPSEGGLLGFAFAPDFATTGHAYVSYTRNAAGGQPMQSVVSRFTSPDGGLTLNPASEQELLVINQPFPNHNGGGIKFGPDGYLYLGMGDGGGDQHMVAQDNTSLLGTFIRIDVSGGGNQYGIPPDNPFAGNPRCTFGSGNSPCPEIFAWGFRNPWRWSFDSATGTLWAGDVGQLSREEINIVERGGNYGWPYREGFICHQPAQNCPSAGLIDPIVDYRTGVDGNAVAGGYVYRGQQLPQLQGRYIFGDTYSGRIWKLEPDTDGGYDMVELFTAPSLFIASFAQSLDGEVYGVDIGGTFQQIVADSGGPGDTIPTLLSQTGCMNAANPTQPASGLIPYRPGAEFWSDGAAKERWLAIPNNTSITVQGDDNFGFPPGSVLVKNFRLQNQLVETRLMMRHPDGIWAGYTYGWNAAQTEATRVVGGATLPVAGTQWNYPSEGQCLQCHTAASSRALGLEIAQLNNPFTYPQTGRNANQLATLEAIDVLTPGLPADPEDLPALPDPFGNAALGDRARAYLHTNCAGCHQPGTPVPSNMDLRFDTPFAATATCDVAPVTGGSLGITDARLIAPGAAQRSLVWERMGRRDVHAMPSIGSLVVDTAGRALIRDWINGLAGC